MKTGNKYKVWYFDEVFTVWECTDKSVKGVYYTDDKGEVYTEIDFDKMEKV